MENRATLPDISDNWFIPNEHLNIKNDIGTDSFGTIYKASFLGIDVIVKSISKGNDGEEKIHAEREIGVLKNCRHPNIVILIGVVKNEQSEGIQIVLEYLAKGDLGHFLLENPEPIDWIQKTKIARDIACGLAYLHMRNIILKNLNPENVYLEDTGKAKICNFGFTHKTAEFRAPEIILDKEYNSQADVFSFGLLLIEIITCKDVGQIIPRSPDNGYLVDEAKLKSQLPKDCPSQFSELGLKCLSQVPGNRPEILKIIEILQRLLRRLVELSKSKNE